MAKINAGQEFGQSVQNPVGMGAPPREAFGVTNGIARAGAELQAEGIQLERQAQYEQKVAREKSDAAVAQYKLYGLRDKLHDTITQIDQGVQDGTIDKTQAAKVWQERSAKVLTDGTQGVPESHLQAVQLDAQGLSESLGSKVGDIVRRRDQSDTRAALNNTLEYTQRLAVTDPEKARSITEESLNQLGAAAGLRPDEIQTARQRWVEGASSTRAYTAIASARGDNKALDVVEKGILENKDLDPQKQAAFLAQISQYRAANEAHALRQAQHAEIVAQRVQRESSAAFNVLSGWALAGKFADPNASAPLLQKLTPQDAAAYRAMAADVPARTAAAMQPLQTQQQELDALYQQRNQRGTSEPLEKEIQRREQVLSQSKKDYADEPLRAANERGVLSSPLRPVDTSSMDGVARGLAERVEQARNASTRTGRAVSPLLTEEAGKLSEMLGALPVAQRAAWVKQISSALPPEMSRALAMQINEKDKALRFAFEDSAQMTTAGRGVSELYLRGAQAMKDGTSLKNEKQPDMKQAQWTAYFSEQVSGMFPNQKTADAARDRALLVAHAIASENGGKLTKDDMDRALRLSLGSGELVPRGQVVTKGGKQQQALIPLPAGMSESDLDARLRAVTPQEIVAQSAAQPTQSPGMTERGNIDLTKRPTAKNQDGSISTVRSMSVNIDGKEVLIPTVADDGKVMSDRQAVDQYLKTGKHLGKFDTPESATAYAKALHTQQDRAYFVRAGGAEMPVADFVKTLPKTPLMPVRPGVFAPLVNGRPVLNSQGQPITIRIGG